MELQQVLARAEAFLQAEGRLLERRIFESLFQGGSREAALLALRAYQNDDGGFGHALLPEGREPCSSPEATAFALGALDALDAFNAPLLEDVFKYLPRQIPALRPTVAIAALLLKHGVVHPWLDDAVEYCVRALSVYDDPPAGSEGEAPSFETLAPALDFLVYADDAAALCPGAEALRSQIESLILEWDLVCFEREGPDHSRTPLDWAPDPLCPGRRMFAHDQIERHLVFLGECQQSDGGWPCDRAAPTCAARLERRGCRTLRAVRTLRAYA